MIDVDFNQAGGGSSGTATGAAVVGTAGNQWNGVSAGPRLGANGTSTSGILFDTTGASTITTTVTLGAHTAYDTGPGYDNRPAAIDPSLMNDYAAASAPATPMTFSINGLTVGGTYNLYLYSQNGGYSNVSQTFTIGLISKTAANSGLFVNPPAFIEGNNYVKFLGLTATGGTISGSVLDSVNQASFNGFQLVSIPEPSSFVLAAFGLLGVACIPRARGRSSSS